MPVAELCTKKRNGCDVVKRILSDFGCSAPGIAAAAGAEFSLGAGDLETSIEARGAENKLQAEESTMPRHRAIGFALLRATFGVVFLFAGIGKFTGGLGAFVGGMNQHFSGKLPAMMVMPFAYVLPFGEVTCGALIVLGLFTRLGLTISGLLLIGLTFGTTMLNDFPTVAHNVQYGLMNFVLLWLSDLNRYSLDSLFGSKRSPGFTA